MSLPHNAKLFQRDSFHLLVLILHCPHIGVLLWVDLTVAAQSPTFNVLFGRFEDTDFSFLPFQREQDDSPDASGSSRHIASPLRQPTLCFSASSVTINRSIWIVIFGYSLMVVLVLPFFFLPSNQWLELTF